MSRLTRREALARLGLKEGATKAEMLKAFKQLALESHPDRYNGDKNKEEKMKRANEAYQVLTDPNHCDDDPFESDGDRSPFENYDTGSPFNLSGVERIRTFSRSIPYICSIPATDEDINAVLDAEEWDLLKYCAERAQDRDVQKKAIDYLFSKRKYKEICSLNRIDKETNHYVLSLLAKKIAMDSKTGTENDLFSEVFEKEDFSRMINFILEHTEGYTDDADTLALFRNACERALEYRLPFDLGMIAGVHYRDKYKLPVVLDVLENYKEWKKLSFACALFLRCTADDKNYEERGSDWRPSRQWRRILSVLERNVEELVKSKEDHGLWRIARFASNPEIGKKAIEGLAGIDAYSSIERVALNADTLYFRKGKFLNPTIKFPTEHGIEVGKYAVDILKQYGKTESLLKISREAKSEEIKTYAHTIVAEFY